MAMAKLNVDIVTPERRLVSTPADEVVAPAAEGLYGVRPGHSPFLSLLAPGPLTVREGTTTRAWFVAGGFFEVQNDRVLVLADQAEPATGIDLEAATEALRSAEQKLATLSPSDPALAAETERVRLARARLDAARAART
jgi:F-type H+-transporting ATPase subunit epsilon